MCYYISALLFSYFVSLFCSQPSLFCSSSALLYFVAVCPILSWFVLFYFSSILFYSTQLKSLFCSFSCFPSVSVLSFCAAIVYCSLVPSPSLCSSHPILFSPLPLLFRSISVSASTRSLLHIVLKVNFFRQRSTSHLRIVHFTFSFFNHKDMGLYINDAVCIGCIWTHCPLLCSSYISGP